MRWQKRGRPCMAMFSPTRFGVLAKNLLLRLRKA